MVNYRGIDLSDYTNLSKYRINKKYFNYWKYFT